MITISLHIRNTTIQKWDSYFILGYGMWHARNLKRSRCAITSRSSTRVEISVKSREPLSGVDLNGNGDYQKVVEDTNVRMEERLCDG